MPTNDYSIANWTQRNAAINENGELSVRPSIVSLSSISDTVIDAFSATRDSDSSVFYYVLQYGLLSGTSVVVYDEYFRQIQSFSWSSSTKVRFFTYGIVNDQVFISSPGMETLWGYVGHELFVATIGESILSSYTLQPIPSGICTAWAGRAVFASNNTLLFSDPLNPRAILSIGFANPPGSSIYSLHVGAANNLVVVTDNGVYSLDVQSSVLGDAVQPIWQLLSYYKATDYRQTAIVRNRVWGLTTRGMRLVDQDKAQAEVSLSEPRTSSGFSFRAHLPDWRAATILEGPRGAIVSSQELGQSAWFDEAHGSWSWWRRDGGLHVVASMGDVFMLQDGFYAAFGEDEVGVTGTLAGFTPSTPGESKVMRQVSVATDSDFGTVFCHDGATQASVDEQAGVVAGTSAGTWTTAKMQSKTFDLDSRTDDLNVEVGATGCGRRIMGSISHVTASTSPRRPRK